MARDGLLPAGLAKLSARGTPVRITIFTALVVAVLAGFIPLGELAALANAGTLAAFTAVSLCMLIMRRRAPDAPRTFRAPLPWLVGGVAVFGCIYLRSEEHTSELQSLMRTSYAVFCLKKKTNRRTQH